MSVLSRPHLPVPAVRLPLYAERMPACVPGVPHPHHGLVAREITVELDLHYTIPKYLEVPYRWHIRGRPDLIP